MKKSHAVFLVSAFIVFAAIFSGGILLSNIRWNDGNPYEKDGLKVKWAVGGATNSYPWIEVWVMHEGNKIEPDISFGGFEDPDLDFRDYDGDGLKDIVFEDGGRVKAVAFFPVRRIEFLVLLHYVTTPHRDRTSLQNNSQHTNLTHALNPKIYVN